ncbi:uncharacterized protein LODBEIA_P26750 [Lodderomyces beijingensis]|uniref:mRNA-decapping enzyme subunit 1 n=1 Tax=Lodderomyces beijingensis TaxID=1775926 RepID=A0ABP0ZMU8_9ASCO
MSISAQGFPQEAAKNSISRDDALKLYTNTLNFNVISRYDPAIKQLLYYTSHCVIYQFIDDEWAKTDYQGVLALYSRENCLDTSKPVSGEAVQSLLCYGLILLNRNNPDCLSIGLVPNNVVASVSDTSLTQFDEMEVELNANLVIVRDIEGKIFGLWIFDEDDRSALFQTIKQILEESFE